MFGARRDALGLGVAVAAHVYYLKARGAVAGAQVGAGGHHVVVLGIERAHDEVRVGKIVRHQLQHLAEGFLARRRLGLRLEIRQNGLAVDAGPREVGVVQAQQLGKLRPGRRGIERGAGRPDPRRVGGRRAGPGR